MKHLISDEIKGAIFEVAKHAGFEVKLEDIALEHPAAEEHGDYSTNIALKLKDKGLGTLKEVAETLKKRIVLFYAVDKVQVEGPGFINFWLSKEWLVENLEREEKNENLKGKKIMVEFAHPNTHKELHIGHMRTLITGEALARIFESCGAKVFRANYQGDIGPHVAKAIWGTSKLLEESKETWDEAQKLSLVEKARLLGQGYVRGNKDYEENKTEIDSLNKKLYNKDPEIWRIYLQTRMWSLDYYDEFYKRFYTKFDKLYFESEAAAPGKKIVLDNVGKVFTESDGAIIFDGERYGLHKRVFVTSDGNPTYEGKEMELVFAEFGDFPFDHIIHVVGSEQAGYFQVVFKAIEQLEPKFVGRQHHLSMGMVQLVGKKISSRTGALVRVDELIDDVKNLLKPINDDKEILEAVTIGAIKYSVLKSSPLLNAVFDLEKSVSLEGDSGPYLQYTYARARSVLRKSQKTNSKVQINSKIQFTNEELAILRYLYRFPEVVEMAARQYAPNLVCSYLFELAKRFNNLYNNCPILGNDLRLRLTVATAQVLKNGLGLLGIEALERM